VLVLAVATTTSTGCAMLGKKNGSSERSGLGLFKKQESNPPPPKFPGSDPLVGPAGVPPPVPPTATAQSPTPAEIALLAGRVVDPYNRPANNTYIRLVTLDGAKESGQPMEVATNPDGYFTIPGLKPGGQYQLIARTKQGEKMLAGITVTQAPNVRVVIQIREEFATSSIPPLPAAATAPASQEKKESRPSATSELEKKDPPPVAVWAPAPPTPSPQPAPADGDLPAKLSVPVPAAATTSTPPNAFPSTVTTGPDKSWPPTLQIGPKKATPAPAPAPAPDATPPPQPPPLPNSGEQQGGLAPLVPSCVVVGKHLQTLALNDVDGQTWNFFKDRRGKLVLLDFWSRNCIHCEKTMPILTQVQNKFGPQGLEVVGVAIDSGTLKDQSVRAKMQCYRLQTNYRQVLGQDEKTNLRGQLGLQGFPTLLLVDDTGQILWSHTGTPDPAVLETVIQKHLPSRTF
jgi:thiol-disulfide isomerase/thioredoxin